MDLAQATNAPLHLEIGGKLRPVRAMTLADWGKLTAWIRDNVPSSTELVMRAAQAARRHGDPLDQIAIDAVLGRAFDEDRNWPPDPTSPECARVLERARGGIARFVHAILSAADQSFTVEEAESLLPGLTADAITALWHVAIFGTPPAPKSQGSTTTETAPSPAAGNESTGEPFSPSSPPTME